MALTTTQLAPTGALARSAPVVTLSPKEYFPYHSTLEAKFFSIPLEIRQQIYSYVFYTPDVAFQKTIKGWRDTPFASDLTYGVNNTALNAVSRRIRSETLPVMYRDIKFRINGHAMFRDFINTATLSDCMHLHIRKVSFVQWELVLNQWHQEAWRSARQSSYLIGSLADLPSLRELELSDQHMPRDKSDYESEEWFNLMDNLRANGGCLRVVAASVGAGGWWFDWRLVGGRNYSWSERVLTKTSVEVRDWNELVEADIASIDFSEVFGEAMRENWTRGPLKHVVIEHGGRKYAIKIWGVPENVRNAWDRKIARKEAKRAYDEQRTKERTKAAPVRLVDSDDEGSDSVGMRSRKTVTREEARARRMEKQRGSR